MGERLALPRAAGCDLFLFAVDSGTGLVPYDYTLKEHLLTIDALGRILAEQHQAQRVAVLQARTDEVILLSRDGTREGGAHSLPADAPTVAPLVHTGGGHKAAGSLLPSTAITAQALLEIQQPFKIVLGLALLPVRPAWIIDVYQIPVP